MKEGISHMHSCPKQCDLVLLVSCQAIHAPQQMWMAGHENMLLHAVSNQILDGGKIWKQVKKKISV